MSTSFDLENEKHSFEKCELVRILSTTITRSNSEFAKLSFDGIYDSITYIGNCYQSLWQEWCDSKILENDILKDTSKWDSWMIEYYNNCKSDYFNTMSEMYCLMQFHTQSMNGDYSWAFKIENLNIIQNHNGLVTTKLVNKLEYLLKKHNFGSLKLEQKDQKYRTRKRGGCKKCNQIRDIKKMLENYIHLQPKQLECNNSSDNISQNETAAAQGIPMMVTYSGQANSATGQGWKTTEIISNNINKNKKNVDNNNNNIDLNNVAINPFQINQLYLPQTEEQIHTGYHTTEVIPTMAMTMTMTMMNNNINNNNNVSCHLSNENHHHSSIDDSSSSSSGSHHSAQNSSHNSKTPALSVSLLNSDESMADDFNLNFNGNNNNNHLSGNESSDDDETISILKELNDLNVELTPTPPPPGQDSFLLFESVPNVEDILASVVADVIIPNEEESKEYELKCYDIMSQQKKEENNVIVPEWYDINKLFSNSGKGSNSNLEDEIAMPDPNVKEWSFEPIDISECKYGELLEMSKPSVIKDNDFGSYLYYIPREYLCNIKIVRQFELAIENLTRWSMNNSNNNNNNNNINGDNNEEAWYTHNDNNNNNNKFSFDYNNNVLRNISPEWLLGTEIKLIDLLSKFPQLNDIVRNNVPNSCLMKKFENGNNFSQLNTINPNYYNTKSEDYASINMFLGGTRTLAIGSMVRNQVFGLNVRFGDLCIMAGKFESCYKHGIPKQSNVNETTLQLSFAKIQS